MIKLRHLLLVLCLTTALAAQDIFKAAASGDLERIRQIVQEDSAAVHSNTENKDTPLHYAAYSGQLEIVKFLVEHQAALNVYSIYRQTPLLLAMRKGRTAVTKYLLEQGADANCADAWGNTPLHRAARTIQLPEIKLLLEHGANIEVRDTYGRTPLLQAVNGGKMEVVDLLVRNGADVQVQNYGGIDGVMYAVMNNDSSMIYDLIIKGAGIKSTDSEGRTVLHHAVLTGRMELVRKIIELGAAIDAVDSLGRTAVDYARRYGHYEIADMLAGKGGVAANDTQPFDLSRGDIRYGEALVIYAGHSGWIVKTQNHLLIFDYQTAVHEPDQPSLANGRIQSTEIKNEAVIVFISHEHFKKDMNYLAQRAGVIDLFFMLAGNPMDNGEAIIALETVQPKYMFPMHGGDNEFVYKEFAAEVKKRMLTTRIVCVVNKGDRFIYKNGDVQTSEY